jgi:hypothetical protein
MADCEWQMRDADGSMGEIVKRPFTRRRRRELAWASEEPRGAGGKATSFPFLAFQTQVGRDWLCQGYKVGLGPGLYCPVLPVLTDDFRIIKRVGK